MDVNLDLERALHLDPQAKIPWREWSEMLDFLNEYFGYVEFEHEDTREEEIRAVGAVPGYASPIGLKSVIASHEGAKQSSVLSG